MLSGLPNFRDLADRTGTGVRRLRRGQVYRSELPAALSDADRRAFASLGIRNVCDLRSAAERQRAPADATTLNGAHLIETSTEAASAAMADLVGALPRVKGATPAEVEAFMHETYRNLPRTLEGHLRAVLQRLADSEGGATLIHCTAGKDRTGFVCAMLLRTLGFRWDAIVADYVASAEFYTLDRLSHHLEQALGHPLDDRYHTVAHELLTAKAAYLQSSFVVINRIHGSVEAYLRERIGVDDALREQLELRLLLT